MIVIDNGIKNVYDVRDRALNLTYKKSENFRWPGYRAKLPEDIEQTYTRFVSFHLDESLTMKEGYFQYVSSEWISGSCHYDQTKYTSITFLSPEPKRNSGIEIYDKKYYCDKYGKLIDKFDPIKRKYYKSNKNFFNKFLFKLKLKQYNLSFIKPQIVENKFNRTFIFDSHRIHRAQNFFGNELKNSRLTLISFFI